MTTNEQTIQTFYTAFQQRDYATMQSCYSDDAVFSDPVFGLLDIQETRAMWEMLCKNAKDFSLVFGNIQELDAEYATCEWTAVYTFSQTGRKVVNKVNAHMRLANGLIIEHSDAFSIYRWTRQALGIPGLVLGWSGWMNKKIQKRARKSLEKFMQS
jgi:ketosteroid isomerase-like protein